jgi:hypothetical protein
VNPDDSLIANAILALWIPLTIGLFFVMKPDKAARVGIFGGLLFLPEVIGFRIIGPALTKQSIPYIGALIGYAIRDPKRLTGLPNKRWVALVIAAFVIGGIGTALTNQDRLTVGTAIHVVLPAMTIKDGIFLASSYLLECGLPLLMGTVMVRNPKDLEDLLRFLVKAGLVYAPFALLETKFSPQLHRWIYGYHQHEFVQTIRFGGYRPTIFMAHGLTVALFFAVCVLSATTLARLPRQRIWGLSARNAALLLALTLLICKSTGAIIYAAVLAPAIWLASYRTKRRLAIALGSLVLLYPSLRGSDLFPTEAVKSWGALISTDRSGSMAYRFDMEDTLLKRARQRPVFGWGFYNRNEGFDERGDVTTVTDGEWIIAIGVTGFVGFFTKFLLLLWPLVAAGRRLRKIYDKNDRRLMSGVSLTVAMCAIDLLPNSLQSNYPYVLAGALLTAVAGLAQQVRQEYLPAATFAARAGAYGRPSVSG